MSISAIILTKNEEKNIESCLKSIMWCDEIIIIDDNSKDNTKNIAKKYKAHFYPRILDTFSAQRNFGIEKAKRDWILFLDADERISKELSKEIQQAIDHPFDPHKGYILKRLDTIWGRLILHGETGNTFLLRLAKKDAGVWEGEVHETWSIKGSIGMLKKPLMHYPHPTIAEFLTKINVYTDLRSKELFDQGVKTNFLLIIMYPKIKFWKNYFFRGGFLDGIPGLVIALMMSFHSFLVRGKLWLLWQKK